MARQGHRVQLEQSDTHLPSKMAKMAIGEFLCAAIKEVQQQTKKPLIEVQEEKKCRVEFLGHNLVKAATERHPAIVYKYHMAGCLSCQNGTAKMLGGFQ